MSQSQLVSRLTEEDIHKLLEQTAGHVYAHILDQNNVKSPKLKEHHDFFQTCTNNLYTTFFFVTSSGEKYIRMTDYGAIIVTDSLISYAVDAHDWEHFLYSIFKEEYEQFWLDYKSKERKGMQKLFRQKLKRFDANTKLEQEKMKQSR